MASKIEIKENGIKLIFNEGKKKKGKEDRSAFYEYSYGLREQLIKMNLKLPFIGWLKVVNLNKK